MVNTTVEVDPDPEPDIRRLPSSNQELPQHQEHQSHHDRSQQHSDSNLHIHPHHHHHHHQPQPFALEQDERAEKPSGGDTSPTLVSPAGPIDETAPARDLNLAPPNPEAGTKQRRFISLPGPTGPGADARVGEKDENGKPRRKTFPEPSWKQSFKNTIKGQPALFLVPILLPVSWALHFSHQNPIAIFITSLLGIVPLAGGLGYATEQLAHRVGESWGGLLNATFGNAVELLIAILALVDGQIDIVQASMIGSILSNVLLVLGMSYFAGGLRFHEQIYAVVGAQMHISLLGISLLAIVLPAAFHYAYPSTQAIVDSTRSPSQDMPVGDELNTLLKASRGLSFILLAVYAMFLTFQLYTHAYLFRIPREPAQHPLPGPQPTHQRVFPRPDWIGSVMSDSASTTSSSSSSSASHGHFRRLRAWSRGRSNSDPMPESPTIEVTHPSPPLVAPAPKPPSPPPAPSPTAPAPRAPSRPPFTKPTPLHAGFAAVKRANTEKLMQQQLQAAAERDVEAGQGGDDEDKDYHPDIKVNFRFAIAMLFLMTALAGVTAEWLIDSINGLTETGNVSREFVGLILLPVIGNSVEHITAVTVSVKDKLNLSMSIAVGSSIQVSLCLLPILVLIGWAIGQPMLLFFDTFETITLVISILLVNFAISDGRTNYLEGFVMMMAYLSIALVCWFYDPQ